jgi:dTMP kinase
LAFEGLDGSGKSTQAARLAAWLAEALGPPGPRLLKEPTDGPFGRAAKEAAKLGRDAAAELGLFLKDRAEDVRLSVEPALAEGRWVVMDRYILSNAAYPGAWAGGDPEAVWAANAGFPWPDLTFVLEVDPLVGLARAARRGAVEAAFENAACLAKVKEVYDSVDRPGLVRLDASKPPGEIFAKIVEAVEGLL